MNIFESSTAQQGERATESTHRKIELQSPADLTYLIANVSQAAREKLAKHFPLEGEDVMRSRVEELVDAYIRDTFELAKDSVSINGMDAREMERVLEEEGREGEELEPFDTKLAQRIQSLTKQIEHETLHLANLRRKAPQETAMGFARAFEKQSEEYEARLRADQVARLKEAEATSVHVGEVARVDEMAGTWDKGRADLAALNSEMGGTIKKMEKAKKAVEVVEEK